MQQHGGGSGTETAISVEGYRVLGGTACSLASEEGQC